MLPVCLYINHFICCFRQNTRTTLFKIYKHIHIRKKTTPEVHFQGPAPYLHDLPDAKLLPRCSKRLTVSTCVSASLDGNAAENRLGGLLVVLPLQTRSMDAETVLTLHTSY